MAILIVGFQEGRHGDTVARALEKRGISTHLRHYADFPRQRSLSLAIGASETGGELLTILSIREESSVTIDPSSIEERNPEMRLLAEFCAFLCREAAVEAPSEDWPSLEEYLRSDSAERTAGLYAELDRRTAARL